MDVLKMFFSTYRLIILRLICLFSVSFFVSSCTLWKSQNSFFFPWEGTNRPHNILYSGKNHLHKRNYTEAGKDFDRIIKTFPSSPQANEAKFYSLLIDFMKGEDLPGNAKIVFPEKPEDDLPYGFYSDFERVLLYLTQQLRKERSSSKNFVSTIELQTEEIESLLITISKLNEKNLKINKKLVQLHDILDKIKTDYGIAKKELEQQRDNYRKIQEIEMIKEKMEKELRELSQ